MTIERSVDIRFDAQLIIGDYQISTFKTGLWKENSYIVRHLPTNDLLVVDPGGRDNELIDAIQHDGGQLKLILLTHAHHDHVGAVSVLSEQFKIPFYLHPGDKKLLHRVPLYAMSIEKRRMSVPTNYCFLENDSLSWGGDPVKYLHVPGHTEGSVCFTWGSLAFTGDTLLCRRVGRTDLPGACPEVLNASIQRMLYTLPSESTLFAGHFEPWLLSEAREWWNLHEGKPPQYKGEGSND